MTKACPYCVRDVLSRYYVSIDVTIAIPITAKISVLPSYHLYCNTVTVLPFATAVALAE